MDFSANNCPLSIDNTLAPGTELQCWDTGAYTQLIIDITDIDAAEYSLIGDPGSEVIIASITVDGRYTVDVTRYSRVCLIMVTPGTGFAELNGYLVDFQGQTVSFQDLCIPFFLSDGTASNIPLTGLQLPFFLSNGASSPISAVPC